ncbi:MAG: DNA double-strand break repair nuclease NurA [Candidatus Asgardarchaeum sp.]
MFEKLIEYVVERKNYLLEKLKNMEGTLSEVAPQDFWREYTPKGEIRKPIVAEDGSFNYIEYKKYLIYAVAAEAVAFDGNNLKIVTNYDVDVLIPYKFIRDRVRFYMSILEKKVVLKLLSEKKNFDYVLLDGSIMGDIIRPAAYAHRPNVTIKNKLRDIFFTKIENSLNSEEFSCVYAKTLYDDVIDIIGNEDIEKITAAMVYLEYLENLLTLSKLLKSESKIIAVSKRSSGNHYFGRAIPDMAIFERYNRAAGFSFKPIKVVDIVSKKYKIAFPILESLFRNISISFFYVRFSKNSTVLKFEIVNEDCDEDYIKEILNDLEPYIVNGYPYLLTRAHRDVKITRKEMLEIAKALGIEFLETTGREML